MHEYPHMSDTAFPDVSGVDVYRYRNEFDYTRWMPDTVIKLCNVPWDSDYANAVKFADDAARDAWFARLRGESITLRSEFRNFPNEYMRLPIPFATLSKYNYIWVEYPTMTSAARPIEYADAGNQRIRYGFFIRSVSYLSPNATECVLAPDVWTNCINDVEITGMQLARGHAPMLQTGAAAFLDDPLDAGGWLLEPEDGGAPSRVRSNASIALNGGSVWACIVTSANPRRDWGTEGGGDWWVPGASLMSNQGVPSYWCFAVDPSVLSLFMQNIDAYTPQFKQTVKGVFFAPDRLVSRADSFNFGGVICWPVDANPVTLQLANLDPDMFGYPARYRNIAKLYTWPYAALVVTDENGDARTVRIENTAGALSIRAALQIAFPFVSIDAVLLGSGAGSGSSIAFSNMTERDFMQWGDWYAHARKWDVPIFGVTQEAAVTYGFDAHFTNAQANAAAQNAYQAAANAASAAQSNANASAALGVSNTALQVAANATMTTNSNGAAAQDTQYANELNQALQAWNAGYARNCQAAEALAETETAAVSIGAGVIGGAAQGAAAGAALGPLGALGGAVAGALSGVPSGIVTAANTAISINLSATKVEASVGNTQQQVTATNTNNMSRTVIQSTTNYDNMTTQNSAATAQAANNQSTANANASRSYNAAIANAGLARSTALSAISNATAQANLGAPREYGAWANGANAALRPMLVSCNVVTQTDYEIARAGDAFLRYGYACNRYWDFERFDLCDHFTYWQCADVWVSGGSGTPEGWQETIKAILRNGVTVWNDADEVNEVSIYDNGF